IFQEKCAPAPFEALPTAIPLLALPRHAMAHNIRALTVGAVKYLKNHESTLVCWSFSASRPRIEDSRSTPLKHLQRAFHGLEGQHHYLCVTHIRWLQYRALVCGS